VTSQRTHVRVGVFVLAAVVVIVGVIVTFGGMHWFEARDHYAVELRESVTGLETGATVSFDGIAVGRVDSINVSPTDLGEVRVELSVKAGTPVHTDTVAYVTMAGLTGLKTIDLRGGSLATPRMPQGGTLAAGEGTLDKLERHADQLADQSIELMKRAQVLAAAAERVTANLEQITDPKPIQAILGQAEQATRTLAAASRSVAAMVDEDRAALGGALGSLDAAARSARDVMANQVADLATNANRLVGDMRGLVQNNAGEVHAAMADLRQASQSFEALAREVRERPSRLLFSSAPRDRKLP